MHVADIDFAELFRPAFESLHRAQQFVTVIKGIPRVKSPAKIILHQVGRMVWLGDRIEEVAIGRPALPLTFLLIAAEAAAKLARGFTYEGRSRAHVRLFFEEDCPAPLRQRLATILTAAPMNAPLTTREIVDLLYDIRCDVVHEGAYFDFHMPRGDDDTPLLNQVGDSVVIANVPLVVLREIVLSGAVASIFSRLSDAQRSAATS